MARFRELLAGLFRKTPNPGPMPPEPGTPRYPLPRSHSGPPSDGRWRPSGPTPKREPAR
jgi:hypothetical protein